jgi:hypothetical protein
VMPERLQKQLKTKMVGRIVELMKDDLLDNF